MQPPPSKRFKRLPSEDCEIALGLPVGTAVPREFASASFPPPDVRRGDDLDVDPEWPPQSFVEFRDDGDRNVVSKERGTLYAVPVGYTPDAIEPLRGMLPEPQVVAQFLHSFYMLPTKLLSPLPLVPWKTAKGKNPKASTRFVAVRTRSSEVRVRVRPAPDGVFLQQLNLNDVLDALLEELPDDAYSIIGLTPWDIFENPGKDGDIFTGGRAYGGSRIALVSMARYHPDLGGQKLIDAAWPLGSRRVLREFKEMEAICAAVEALPKPSSMKAKTKLWLARTCKTAAHEIGHCFGLDHCVYFACLMQGSDSLGEEHERQPSYLCAVCLRKILFAVNGDGGGIFTARDHYLALRNFCTHPDRADVAQWVGLNAWATLQEAKLS